MGRQIQSDSFLTLYLAVPLDRLIYVIGRLTILRRSRWLKRVFGGASLPRVPEDPVLDPLGPWALYIGVLLPSHFANKLCSTLRSKLVLRPVVTVCVFGLLPRVGIC